MRELYISPEVELIKFDEKDVITTSPNPDNSFTAESSNVANQNQGWSGLY